METAYREIDDETLGWKIKITRNAIAQDWAELATQGLSSEQRKLIRERLQTSTKALRQLVGPSWYASQPVESKCSIFRKEAVEKALRAEPNT